MTTVANHLAEVMSAGTPADSDYAGIETYYDSILQDVGKLLRYALNFDSTKLPTHTS